MLVDSPCEVPWHGTRLPVNVKEGRVNNCFTWYMSRLYREVLFHTRENHFPYQKHDVGILRRLLVYCVYYCWIIRMQNDAFVWQLQTPCINCKCYRKQLLECYLVCLKFYWPCAITPFGLKDSSITRAPAASVNRCSVLSVNHLWCNRIFLPLKWSTNNRQALIYFLQTTNFKLCLNIRYCLQFP